MIHKDTFNQIDFNGSKGLVYIGNKILAYRRDNKAPRDPLCIDLPGGGREGNESPFDTFKREVFEEFGLLINESDIKSSYAMPSFIQPEKNSFFFITKNLNVSESEIRFGDEGSEWFLMTPEDFVTRPDGIKRQQKRVKEVLNI